MALKVGINGFGRIGRLVMRAAFDRKAPIEFVGVNDLVPADNLGYLLKHDSIHGRFAGTVENKGETTLVVNGQEIPTFSQRDPAQLPWGKQAADYIVESTGLFTDAEGAGKHITGGAAGRAQGAKKVLISAPAKGPDVTVVVGVNHDSYDPAKHQIISNASCTTNCLAPLAKVLNDTFGIKRGWMTTIHSYTNDQNILDLPHKDLRRARAAALSMIPTSTGAASALKEVLPALAGKLDGMAIRVPTPNVSIVDLTVRLSKSASRDDVNNAFRSASQGYLKGVMAVTEEPVVSVDFNGDRHSATVDLSETIVLGELVKVLAWYDNEMGYSQRLFDLAKFVASKL